MAGTEAASAPGRGCWRSPPLGGLWATTGADGDEAAGGHRPPLDHDRRGAQPPRAGPTTTTAAATHHHHRRCCRDRPDRPVRGRLRARSTVVGTGPLRTLSGGGRRHGHLAIERPAATSQPSRAIATLACPRVDWTAFAGIGVRSRCHVGRRVGVLSQFIPVVRHVHRRRPPVVIALIDSPATGCGPSASSLVPTGRELPVPPRVTAHDGDHVDVASSVIVGSALLGPMGAARAATLPRLGQDVPSRATSISHEVTSASPTSAARAAVGNVTARRDAVQRPVMDCSRPEGHRGGPLLRPRPRLRP